MMELLRVWMEVQTGWLGVRLSAGGGDAPTNMVVCADPANT